MLLAVEKHAHGDAQYRQLGRYDEPDRRSPAETHPESRVGRVFVTPGRMSQL